MRNGGELNLQSSSEMNHLDPFIDENQVFRVGGRINWSNLNTEYIHPIFLSGTGVVTDLRVKWYHQSVGHGRRRYILYKIRSSGYWIAKTNSAVWSFISRCVRCRYLRAKFGEEKMADLSADRISTEPPGLTSFIHLWSNNTERKWNNTESNSPAFQVVPCTLK